MTRLIGRFLAQYPEIGIALTLSDRYVDLVDEGIDIAIRLTSKPPDSMVARRLADIEYVVCASPAYLAARAPVAELADLAAHNCLINGYQPDAPWRFTRDGAAFEIAVQGSFIVNSSESLRVAVLDGVGIGLLPTYAVGADLRAGSLLPLLGQYRPEGAFGNSVYATFLPTRFSAPKMRAFVDFLIEQFQAGPSWDR